MSSNPRWRSDTHVVEFTTDVDGKQTICWISEEALSDHFGMKDRNDSVRALFENLDRIAPVAVRVAHRTAPGDRIVIKTADF